MKTTTANADQRYINDVLAIAMNQSSQSINDPFRPAWHFAPQFGLLNDPNGLAHFNGEYHLFYQWNPKACQHGAKAWGHATSKDLINWSHQPLALAPTEEYETHGCYSGSGLVVDGKLELFYTGNVKFEQGGRTAYQCRATLEAGKQVEKQGIVLPLPEGYSGHVRDPKVWQYQDAFYMVLGAEDLNYRGKVITYRSDDLNNWEMIGEIFGDGVGSQQSDDFMLECPDLLPLDDKYVLITCPKNWVEKGGKKVETFDVTYHIGNFDHQTASFEHSNGVLMDHGFDFYAPQTFEDEAGRRILFGWMGKPDEFEPYQPTIELGWIHQMTCARELTIRDNTLVQKPVKELEALRHDQLQFTGLNQQFSGLSAELILEQLEGANIRLDIADDFYIESNPNGLVTWRKNLKTAEWESIIWQGTVNSLHLLRDHSSIEVFINGGVAVSTSRFFGLGLGEEMNIGFELSSNKEIAATHWQLSA
ncbi:sucrose-6-phosphate hydrolase [Photobacterium rosenbergii]|uniref:Sucrose-6-phosphate hydrolase n=1 Tax=Photobacterium rosenbergii TaxID=294936 RepID=A0A2T3NH30_9GAMM|nr:sucrose-6-phosphate hydrolase [Photobacterium rosenbergii]PSW14326.1 sucrose-6-phosphate hydrolase [Photobacterium rosenbergii]